MAIITTPAAPDANSYATLAQANDYLANRRLYATSWTVLTDEQKSVALVWATSLLDQSFAWVGASATSTQALRWPRIGARRWDIQFYASNIIPQPVVDATCELAYQVTLRDPTAVPALFGKGFSEAKLGAMSVKVDKGAMNAPMPDSVVRIISGADLGDLLPSASGGGLRQMPLRRS